MQRSIIRMAQYGLEGDMTRGIHPFRARVKDYKSYQSRFGPQYKTGYHIAGYNISSAKAIGTLAGGMGAVAGIFALFFFDGVPRVQKDILQKIPLIGRFYVHEVPPEDNPF